jgi:hypothetical protein
MSIFSRDNKVIKICASVLLVALLYVPTTPFNTVQKADAQVVVTGGLLVNDVGGNITSSIQALSTLALENKELILDGLVHSIAQAALRQMTDDIVRWINSGFEGNPAFITDLSGYLLNVADMAAGDFIYNNGLTALCTPFKLDVQIALAVQYQNETHEGYRRLSECTINEPEVDVEAFLSGDFNAGGWPTWFETVLNPENTPIGAYIGGKAALDAEIAKNQFVANEDVRNGNGFISQKVCDENGKNCVITTPGSIIKSQLEFTLTIPGLSLIQSDELNEIINALFGQLAKQAITGINGLLGLGGNASFSSNSFGSNGNSSYLDAVAEEGVRNSNSTQIGGNKIQQTLETETNVLELQLEIVDQIEAVTVLYTDAKEVFEDDSCWDLEIPTNLSNALEELLVQVPKTITTVLALQELSNAYTNATDAQTQSALLQQLTSLQSAGEVLGQTAIMEYQYYISSELQNTINAFIEDISDEEDACS